MKSLISKLLLFTGIIALSQGCSLNDEEGQCFNRAYMAALSVSGPPSAPVNVEVEFMVTFPIVNSCGVFNDFVDLTTTFPKNIAAAVDYTGCECTPTTTQVTKPYKFKATVPGTYELRFLTEDEDAPIIRTIVVTQ